MRIVFCGTADFAVPSLRATTADHELLAVVTQPDRPGSRGRPAPRPVGDVAEEMSIPVLRPERIRDPQAVDSILALGPDALVVAAYGQIIPAALLDGPRLGGVNVHGSLLPRWRGAAPVAAAIVNGDDRTGVSIMRMDPGLDTGPVYAQREVEIAPDEIAPVLSQRLALAGAALLAEVLRALGDDGMTAVAQDDARATLAPRLRREDGALEWAGVDAIALDRRVRGLQPWPGVTLPLGGVRVRVIDGASFPARDGGDVPGEVLEVHGEALDVATARGVYRLCTVQPPGGRPMSAAAFARGRRGGATDARVSTSPTIDGASR